MKSDAIYLRHMLDISRRVHQKMTGVTRDAFDADDELQLSVLHLLQNIGEAARSVSEATRQQMSDIPWRQIVRMRHRIVHDYMGVDFTIVWETARDDIPTLIELLEQLVSQSECAEEPDVERE